MALLVIGAFILFIVLFTLAAWFGTRYAGEKLGSRISDYHRAAEHIIDNGRVPPFWIRPSAGGVLDATRFERRRHRQIMRKANRLLTYMERTPAFSDVESREFVLTELRRIRSEWRNMSISEMLDRESEG